VLLGEFNKTLLQIVKLQLVTQLSDHVLLLNLQLVLINVITAILQTHAKLQVVLKEKQDMFVNNLQNLVMMDKHALLIHVMQLLENVLIHLFNLHNVQHNVKVTLIVLLGEFLKN
jgi:hypothetical protein